jgi:hypothetical protein
MALGNLFTPDLRPPLAFLHPTHMLLRVHELSTNVDKFDGASASGDAIQVRHFRRTMVREIKGYITRFDGLLSPPMSFSIFACPFQNSREDRFLMSKVINEEE